MIADGKALLADEGTAPEAMAVQRFLDVRYVGQEFPIQTPVSDDDLRSGDPARVRRSFDELHDRRYGHQAVNEPVEVVNLRLTVNGRRERLTFPRIESGAGDALFARNPVVLDDPEHPVECPVYDRDKLAAGFERRRPGHHLGIRIHDRAVGRRCDDGRRRRRNDRNHWSKRMIAAQPAKLDPVTLEVLRNAFPAIADEMSVDLQRTSYNMMIYEIRDYCCALLDTEGRLISQNIGGVSHFVADLGVVIKDGIKRYGRDGFAPGDVLLMNHQRVAGQHLNNVLHLHAVLRRW